MWTLKWGAKSGPRFGVRRIVFSFRGPQNGVQILGTILGSTLPVFFSQHDAQKGHPRVGCEQVRLLHKHIAGTVPGHVAIKTTNLLTSILFKMSIFPASLHEK